jgi:hypothetical protein
MSLILEDLSAENQEVVKSLREFGLSDEEIEKSLIVETLDKKDDKDKGAGDNIQKSIDDEILAKEQELEALKSKKINKGADDTLSNTEFNNKIEEINKSVSDQLGQTNEKFDGLGTLIKSLTGVITELKESNETLHESNETLAADNAELKKSINDTKLVIDKISEMTPGLKASKSGLIPTERFQKSTSEDGKEILSKSANKEDLSAKLSTKMDNEEFIKSHGDDVANYEVSGVMSDKLEKAITDEFNIQLVD